VRQRTQNILSFKSLVNRNLGKSIDSNAIKRLNEEDIDGMFRNPHLVLSAKATITNIRNLKSLIVELEKAALPDVSATTPYDLLLTVPGIGKALGMTIALETGDKVQYFSHIWEEEGCSPPSLKGRYTSHG